MHSGGSLQGEAEPTAAASTMQAQYDFADERAFRQNILLNRGFSLAHARIREEHEFQKELAARNSEEDNILKGVANSAKKAAYTFADDAKTIASDVIDWPRNVWKTTKFYASNLTDLRTELLGGLSIAIILIPEGIAFAYIAEMPPMMGLYATFILGFIAAALSGRPPIVSGAAGAVAVVVKDITSSSGPLSHLPMKERQDHLLMAMIICGVIQMLVGIFKLGSFSKVFPHSGLIGFCNGLALVLIRSQLTSFKKCDVGPNIPAPPYFDLCPSNNVRWLKIDETATWLVAMHVGVSLVIMHFWKWTPKIGKIIPASIVALIIGSAIEHGLIRAASGNEYSSRTIAETAPISSSMPSWRVPSVSSSNTGTLFEFGAYGALIGLIESIIALQLLSQLMEERATDRQVNQECFAQGLGNFVCGFFNGMGGGALLGESVLMRTSGAHRRLSSMSCAWFVMILVLIASEAINLVPVGTLSGVIVAAALHTFYWPCLRILHRIRKSDSIIIIVVTVLSLILNLALAALIGTMIAALNSMWDTSKLLAVHRHVKNVNSNEGPESNVSPVTLELQAIMPLNRPLGMMRPIEEEEEEEEEVSSSTCTTPEAAVKFPLTIEMEDGQVISADAPFTSLDVQDSKINRLSVTYYVEGVLFFASFRDFSSYFNPAEDPECVTIDFSHAVVSDLSGVTAVCGTARRYSQLNKRVRLYGLDMKSVRQCKKTREFTELFRQTGFGGFLQVTSDEDIVSPASEDPKNDGEVSGASSQHE